MSRYHGGGFGSGFGFGFGFASSIELVPLMDEISLQGHYLIVSISSHACEAESMVFIPTGPVVATSRLTGKEIVILRILHIARQWPAVPESPDSRQPTADSRQPQKHFLPRADGQCMEHTMNN